MTLTANLLGLLCLLPVLGFFAGGLPVHDHTGSDSGGTLPTLPGTLTLGTALTKDPIAVNTKTVQAHGLSRAPDGFFGYMECKTAEHNYAVGQRIPWESMTGGLSANTSLEVTFTATNTILLIPNNNPQVYDNNAPAGGLAPTPANWKIFITPWIRNA